MATPQPTHPQQYVQFDGKPVEIEEAVDIIYSSSRGDHDRRVDATFRNIGRRMGLVMPAAQAEPTPRVDSIAAKEARFNKALDACCKIAVKR
jgi:hypothetical protein